MTLPLSGLTVLDLSRILAGPYATMMLGDLGARVIKVERPGSGDDTRQWGPPFVGDEEETKESTYFLAVNRNKESVTLDLRDDADREVFLALVGQADVVVENFRNGVMDRLGFGPEQLLTINPRLVIASITGFGHDGPEADRPGFDQIVQGEAGLMSVTGPCPSTPSRVGIPIADLTTALFTTIGILTRLQERERTGRGGVVRSSLLSSVVSLLSFQGARYLVAGEVPQAQGNRHPTVAPYGMYPTSDGHIQIAVGSPALWETFAPLVGLDHDDERFATNSQRRANSEELDANIGRAFTGGTTVEWQQRLEDAGIPAGRVRGIDEVFEWAQVAAQDLIVEVDHLTAGRLRLPGSGLRFDDHPQLADRPPPVLGEHDASVRAGVDVPENP